MAPASRKSKGSSVAKSGASSESKYDQKPSVKAERQLRDLKHRTEAIAVRLIKGDLSDLPPKYKPAYVIDKDQGGRWEKWISLQDKLMNRATTAKGHNGNLPKASQTTRKEFLKLAKDVDAGLYQDVASSTTKRERNSDDDANHPPKKRKQGLKPQPRIRSESQSSDDDDENDDEETASEPGAIDAKPSLTSTNHFNLEEKDMTKSSSLRDQPSKPSAIPKPTVRPLNDTALQQHTQQMASSLSLVNVMVSSGTEVWRRMNDAERKSYADVHLTRFRNAQQCGDVHAEELYKKLDQQFAVLHDIDKVIRQREGDSAHGVSVSAEFSTSVDFLINDLLSRYQAASRPTQEVEDAKVDGEPRIDDVLRYSKMVLQTRHTFEKKGILIILMVEADPSVSFSGVSEPGLLDIINAIRKVPENDITQKVSIPADVVRGEVPKNEEVPRSIDYKIQIMNGVRAIKSQTPKSFAIKKDVEISRDLKNII